MTATEAGNLLFAQLDIPDIDKDRAASEITSLGDRYSFWNAYRGMYMTPLMSKTEDEFVWTDFTPKCISDWFDDYVFPFIGMRSRIMVLHTPPGAYNLEHIDCERHELNTLQHKFRVVLQGQTDSLYFITKQGHVNPPKIDKPYIMDGGWPHGMHNYDNKEKLTLALGYPFVGRHNYNDRVKLLLNRNDYEMPEDLEPYWNHT